MEALTVVDDTVVVDYFVESEAVAIEALVAVEKPEWMAVAVGEAELF